MKEQKVFIDIARWRAGGSGICASSSMWIEDIIGQDYSSLIGRLCYRGSSASGNPTHPHFSGEVEEYGGLSGLIGKFVEVPLDQLEIRFITNASIRLQYNGNLDKIKEQKIRCWDLWADNTPRYIYDTNSYTAEELFDKMKQNIKN